MTRFILGIAALALSSAANAQTMPSILGLQLGAVPTVRECARMVEQYPDPDGAPAPYDVVNDRGECLIHGDQPKGGVDDGSIIFPIDAMPTLMGFNWVGDRLINGKLVELGIVTLDYNQADYIVTQLTTKFGKPDSDQKSIRDMDTIAVPNRVVVWHGPGYRVEYDSVGANIDHGLVLVQTDAALAQRQQEKAVEHAKQTAF